MPNIDEQFEEAANSVQDLSERPDNDTLLQLYGLYKQATEGDCSGSRPGMFNMKERAKYDAWMAIEGMGKEQAKQEYIAMVNQLLEEE